MAVSKSDSKFYLLLVVVIGMGGNTIYSEISENDDKINQTQTNQILTLQSQITAINDKPPQVIQGIDGLRGEKGERGLTGEQGQRGVSGFDGRDATVDMNNFEELIDDARKDHDKDNNRIRNILDDITTDYEIFIDEISDTIKRFTKIFDNIESHQDTQDNRIDTNQQDITQLRKEMNAEFEAIKEEYGWQ